jgi:hypothetical protein
MTDRTIDSELLLKDGAIPDGALVDEMELASHPNICGCVTCITHALAEMISRTSDPTSAFTVIGLLVQSKLRDQAGFKQH